MQSIKIHKIPSNKAVSYPVIKWCRKFQDGMENATTVEEIIAAKNAADEAIGLRCFGVEVLLSGLSPSREFGFIYDRAILVAKAGIEHQDTDSLTEILSQIRILWPGLETNLTWHLCEPGEAFNFYRWQYERSQISIEAPTAPISHKQEAAEDLIRACKSQSQRNALFSLASSARAILAYHGSLGDIKLRRCAWVVGPSGSGKTWVARQFAKSMGLPFYEATVAGWSLRNAKSDHSTIAKILALLESGPITVIVDEICKIRQGSEGNNSNWFRAVQDEIMSLSTGTLQDFAPSQTALANLKRSWIIFCGAFQELYRKKAAGEIMLAEQVEDLTLSYEEISDSRWLPDELINRMGLFVHVGPPSVDELSEAMKSIEAQAEITISAKARNAAAYEAILRMQGFRGLEEYAMKCARMGADQKARIEKRDDDSQPPSIGSDWH